MQRLLIYYQTYNFMQHGSVNVINKCSIYLQPYPNDEDVELMSKDPSAYIHAHAEVERLKEEKREEERNLRSYDDQYHRDGRKKPVKVVSDKLF